MKAIPKVEMNDTSLRRAVSGKAKSEVTTVFKRQIKNKPQMKEMSVLFIIPKSFNHIVPTCQRRCKPNPHHRIIPDWPAKCCAIQKNTIKCLYWIEKVSGTTNLCSQIRQILSQAFDDLLLFLDFLVEAPLFFMRFPDVLDHVEVISLEPRLRRPVDWAMSTRCTLELQPERGILLRELLVMLSECVTLVALASEQFD